MTPEAQQAFATALASDESGAVQGALVASIASGAALDADAVEIARVEEALGGAFDFDLGEAAADVANAFADPASRAAIERAFGANGKTRVRLIAPVVGWASLKCFDET